MPKRSPEEVIQSIVDSSPVEDDSIDDDIQSVLSMTPEERRRELEAAGVDMRELRAKAAAWRGAPAPPAEAPPKRAPARVIQLRPWLRSALPLAAAAAVVGLVAVRWLQPVQEYPVGRGRPSAAELRGKAVEDCNAQRWRKCLDELDGADRDDPQGGLAPTYQSLRARADAALRDAAAE